MKSHISAICKASFYQLRDISAIRKYLANDAAKTIVHAFVTSRIDSCNSLLYGLPQKDINHLKIVHHAAARVISKTRKYDHITPILKELHWFTFKYLVITWKALHRLAPKYLCDLIHIDEHRARQSNNVNILYTPKTKVVSGGDRAFSKAAPKLWNALPIYLRCIESLDSLEAKLKTYLFKLHFG